MIPETITIPVAACFQFALIVGPSLFLGWILGIFTSTLQIRKTGYRIVWKRVGLRSWPVMEKLKQESSKQ